MPECIFCEWNDLPADTEECWRINSRSQYPRPEQPDNLIQYVKELEGLIKKMK